MTPLLHALVLVLLLATPTLAINITSCDQAVAPGDVGMLQNDLSCGAIVGVILDKGATLAMNGHSIAAATGVFCVAKKCTIQGPGEITGGSPCAIQPANNVGRITITVVGPIDIHDNQCGIAAANPADVKLRLTDVTVRDNDSGVSAGKITGTNVVVTGNGSGGIMARGGVRLNGCTIQNNGGLPGFSGLGLLGFKGATLLDCILTGNAFDLATHRKPRLRDTTCGHSVQVVDPPTFPDAMSPTWGVCAND